MILPLQDRIEEWKKSTLQLDKEHTKEMKRLRQEFKKRQICDPLMTSSSFRAKKHSARMSKNSKYDFGIYGTIGAINKSSNSSLSRSLDSEMECSERLQQQSLMIFEDLEKKAVRRALIEERSHFCLLVNFLRPVVEEEIGMIQEISHIQEIMESLCKLTTDPFDLPPTSETVISNLKLNKNGSTVWNFQTPPSSPSSLGSRKSSMCSISSYNSSSSSSTYGQTGPNKYLSLTHVSPAKWLRGLLLMFWSFQIPTSTYTTNIYSQSNIQSDSAYLNNSSKKIDSTSALQPFSADVSQLESISNNGRYGSDASTPTRPFDGSNAANELQFPLDSTDSSDAFYSKNPPLIMNSTNPFLSSYNPEGIYQSTSTPSQICYSEGSITPTNSEQVNVDLFTSTSSSTRTEQQSQKAAKSSKPPPAPPVRRTSSISNPNAITLGTLKNAGISPNYEDGGGAKNMSVYDEINVLTKSMNDINYTLKYTDFANTGATTSSPSSNSPQSGQLDDRNLTKSTDQAEEGHYVANDKSEYQSVKNVFENHYSSSPPSASRPGEEDASQLPLPAPPPEAFMDVATATATNHHHEHHHYNKITNVHRDFLETLNSKLSQSPLVHQSSSRISKRRSSSQSASDDGDSTLSYG